MHKKLVLLVIIAAAAAVGMAVASAATSSARATTVPVKLREYKVIVSKPSAPTGKVTFVITNTGKKSHEFVVIKTPKPASQLLKPGGTRAEETGTVDEVENVPPGTTKTLTLTLGKSHYALLCNRPGHYARGQYSNFVVG